MNRYLYVLGKQQPSLEYFSDYVYCGQIFKLNSYWQNGMPAFPRLIKVVSMKLEKDHDDKKAKRISCEVIQGSTKRIPKKLFKIWLDNMWIVYSPVNDQEIGPEIMAARQRLGI